MRGRTSGQDPRLQARKQKHDRRDALLLMKLLAEDRFPRVWMPSMESAMCERCCCIAISGCAFGCGYRTRCSRLSRNILFLLD